MKGRSGNLSFPISFFMLVDCPMDAFDLRMNRNYQAPAMLLRINSPSCVSSASPPPQASSALRPSSSSVSIFSCPLLYGLVSPSSSAAKASRSSGVICFLLGLLGVSLLASTFCSRFLFVPVPVDLRSPSGASLFGVSNFWISAASFLSL